MFAQDPDKMAVESHEICINKLMENPEKLATLLYMCENPFNFYAIECFDDIIAERFKEPAALFKLGLLSESHEVDIEKHEYFYLDNGRIKTFKGENLYEHISKNSIREYLQKKIKSNPLGLYLNCEYTFNGINPIHDDLYINYNKSGIKGTIEAYKYEKAELFVKLVKDVRHNGKNIDKGIISDLGIKIFLPNLEIDWRDIYPI